MQCPETYIAPNICRVRPQKSLLQYFLVQAVYLLLAQTERVNNPANKAVDNRPEVDATKILPINSS